MKGVTLRVVIIHCILYLYKNWIFNFTFIYCIYFTQVLHLFN